MKVRDLMKELIDLDPEADIRINILGGGMPDNLEYHTGNHYFMIDYSNTSDAYDIYFSAMDFKNNKMYRVEDIYRFNYDQQCNLIEVDLLDSFYAKKARDKFGGSGNLIVCKLVVCAAYVIPRPEP